MKLLAKKGEIIRKLPESCDIFSHVFSDRLGISLGPSSKQKTRSALLAGSSRNGSIPGEYGSTAGLMGCQFHGLCDILDHLP